MNVVQTKDVKDRRAIMFMTCADLHADAQRLVEAERAGRLRSTGNWSLGQALNHLTTWMSYPYEGYPPELRPPWFVRAVLKLSRKRFFGNTMRAGVRIPGLEHGTMGTEPMPTEDAWPKFEHALARLDSTPPAIPNVIFGPLSHEEWKRMNLNHAQLHLSFQHPG